MSFPPAFPGGNYDPPFIILILFYFYLLFLFFVLFRVLLISVLPSHFLFFFLRNLKLGSFFLWLWLDGFVLFGWNLVVDLFVVPFFPLFWFDLNYNSFFNNSLSLNGLLLLWFLIQLLLLLTRLLFLCIFTIFLMLFLGRRSFPFRFPRLLLFSVLEI